jgi:phosphatidate phosphatase LPIN
MPPPTPLSPDLMVVVVVWVVLTWDREVILRKPEVFKMACLRDLQHLFTRAEIRFYAGFGNRITDALSYRSVGIPSSRIFTINSNAEVSLPVPVPVPPIYRAAGVVMLMLGAYGVIGACRV